MNILTYGLGVDCIRMLIVNFKVLLYVGLYYCDWFWLYLLCTLMLLLLLTYLGIILVLVACKVWVKFRW